MARQKLNSTQQTSELGYAQNTTDVAFTTLTQITNLSVTVTVPAGATLHIIGYIPQIYSTVATDRVALSIYQDGVFLTACYGGGNLTSNQAWGGACVQARVQPTAGSHTYAIYGTRDTGTGTGHAYADTNSKSFIQVRIV